MHLVHINKVPHHLTEIVASVTQFSTRLRLQSADTAAYIKPRTRIKFCEHIFSFAGPDAWNSLPSHLHCITDTADFKRKLKTELFRQAFDQWLLFLFNVFYHISAPGRFCRVVLYKFYLYL